jgi:hypothetical protein
LRQPVTVGHDAGFGVGRVRQHGQVLQQVAIRVMKEHPAAGRSVNAVVLEASPRASTGKRRIAKSLSSIACCGSSARVAAHPDGNGAVRRRMDAGHS